MDHNIIYYIISLARSLDRNNSRNFILLLRKVDLWTRKNKRKLPLITSLLSSLSTAAFYHYHCSEKKKVTFDPERLRTPGRRSAVGRVRGPRSVQRAALS